jgi:hypothetical protein
MTPESSIAVVISVAIPEMSCTERLLMINERKTFVPLLSNPTVRLFSPEMDPTVRCTLNFHSFLLGTKEMG